MRPQNIIIFSSGKNLDVARRIACNIKGDSFKPIVWDQYFTSVFEKDYDKKKSYPLFRLLTKKIPSFDFAIVVAGNDDTTLKDCPDVSWENVCNALKGKKDYVTTRDNVIFELGLCAMALGEERVILVHHIDVRIIEDLRGRNSDQNRQISPEDNQLHSTMLTDENVQIKTFNYTDIKSECKELTLNIQSYIIDKNDSFSPVVIGAACSTASGYLGNFVFSLCYALNAIKEKKKNFNCDIIQYQNDVCDSSFIEKILSPDTMEIHILLPAEQAISNNKISFKDPKKFLFPVFYPQYQIMNNYQIKDKRRPIQFCCKIFNGKIYIIDFPTTILSSYEVAQKIIEIDADDRKELDQETRFLTKEIDNFMASMKKLLFWDDKKKCYFARNDENGTFYPFRIFLDSVTFNHEIDINNLPWLQNESDLCK